MTIIAVGLAIAGENVALFSWLRGDLRDLSQRVDCMETGLSERIDRVEQKLSQRIDDAGRVPAVDVRGKCDISGSGSEGHERHDAPLPRPPDVPAVPFLPLPLRPQVRRFRR